MARFERREQEPHLARPDARLVVGGGARTNSRARSGLFVALTCVSAGLLVLTLFWTDWVEAVFGFDPDRHNGSFEWLIVAGLIGLTVSLGALARSELRSSAPDER